MTYQSCLDGMDQLGKGWTIPISKEQVTAIHERVKHIPESAWKVAISDLLANHLLAPRSGLLSAIIKAADEAMEHERKTRMARERAEANRAWTQGYTYTHHRTAEEQDYGNMRMRAMRLALQSGAYAVTMRDTLLAWMESPEHAAWARAQTVPMTGVGPVTRLEALVHEVQRWDDRAKEMAARVKESVIYESTPAQ